MRNPVRARIPVLDEKAEAEKLAALLPSLILAAEHLASSFDMGVHGRRRTGSGEDFWQFKQYGPDDPATSIDWRQSAKREQVFIRQKEQETSESVWFWRDNTQTMHFGSSSAEGSKIRCASVLSLALALLLSKGGEKYGLLGKSEKAATGMTAFNKFSHEIMEEHTLGLPQISKLDRLPRKATVVMLSDFLSPLEEIKSALQTFVNLGCNGLLIHIADPVEVDLPFKGRTRFQGVSTEDHVLFGRTEAVKDDYQKLFNGHRLAVQTAATRLSWEYAFHRTDEPASNILAQAYLALRVKGN